MARDLPASIESLDINPFIVCAAGQGAWAADCVVVLRPSGEDRSAWRLNRDAAGLDREKGTPSRDDADQSISEEAAALQTANQSAAPSRDDGSDDAKKNGTAVAASP